MRACAYSAQEGLSEWTVIKTIAPVFKFPGTFAPAHHKHLAKGFKLFFLMGFSF